MNKQNKRRKTNNGNISTLIAKNANKTSLEVSFNSYQNPNASKINIITE